MNNKIKKKKKAKKKKSVWTLPNIFHGVKSSPAEHH
jgi:hypothetical protein